MSYVDPFGGIPLDKGNGSNGTAYQVNIKPVNGRRLAVDI